ncbi:MAG: hypothetical protein IPK11_15325 [Ignavibacteria bacterium]|nr:hypothetical protein [Ignavibacteria bacterium]
MYYLIATLYIIFIFSLIAALTCLRLFRYFFVIKHLKSKYWVNSVWLTDKRLRVILASITIIFAAFQTYTAFYQPTVFSNRSFQATPILAFRQCKILVKGSTYPDIHGDYSASAIIHIDEPTIKTPGKIFVQQKISKRTQDLSCLVTTLEKFKGV